MDLQILDDLKRLTNLRTLILTNRLHEINNQLCLLQKKSRVLKLINIMKHNIPNDISFNIIQTIYRSWNISTIQKQKKKKQSVICELNGNMEYYAFKQPVNISSNNEFYNDIVKNTDTIITMSKYCFKVEDNKVLGVYNLDIERTATLCQFRFFCERLRDHLINDNILMIYPREKRQLFQMTPIGAFRVLYYLYKARDTFLKRLKNRELDKKEYVNSIIKYMRSYGHSISTVRNHQNAMVFHST